MFSRFIEPSQKVLKNLAFQTVQNFSRTLTTNNTYDAIVIGAGSIGLQQQWNSKKQDCVHLRFSQHGKKNTDLISNGKREATCSQCIREVDEEALKSLIPYQRSFGMEIGFVDADRVKQLVPGINTDSLRGGIWSPNDGSASPLLSALAFYRYAKELGADFHFKEEAQEILKDSHGKVSGVKTEKSTFHAPIVIDAAGAYSTKLMKSLRLQVPVTPDSHEAGITEPTEHFFSPMVVDMRPSTGSKNYYFYQNSHGQIVFCITPDPVIPGTDREETSVFLPQVSKRMISILPRLQNVRVRRTWRGLYPMTPDGNPLLGWNRNLPGLFTATGMCGQGFMLGPGYAKTIRNSITNNLDDNDKTILKFVDPHRSFADQKKEVFK
ncbi:fad-dependent oxidoreductase domain-containing protein [Anaeramoeba ignava]|uniref:FAD-dependent oxidoreductase domain-containing protein 1 n=1 Tax=Anaeramoeba ignava TaxID=1746090 RepID=A0A9Q0LXX5_ANAIG|nr:fad-dependent oxidoreductase domain-containing protein [Anaeramoeba ignava]